MFVPDRPRDRKTDEAAEAILQMFAAEPERIFYTTQIETRLERDFFHWITARALREVADAGKLQRLTDQIQGQPVNFYTHARYRYWRREQKRLRSLIEQIHDPNFTHAVGRHGEMMFDSALSRRQFTIHDTNTNKWEDKAWTETNHNLDRIVVRDGIAYGIEIKNTQGYIPLDELKVKLRLCDHLGLTPLFIMRFAPKSYIHEVSAKHHGFVLLYEDQLYPFGYDQLAREVRETLGLKVHAPRDVNEGHIQRLVGWHKRRLGC